MLKALSSLATACSAHRGSVSDANAVEPRREARRRRYVRAALQEIVHPGHALPVGFDADRSLDEKRWPIGMHPGGILIGPGKGEECAFVVELANETQTGRSAVGNHHAGLPGEIAHGESGVIRLRTPFLSACRDY